MKILITGGAGFQGSHLAADLLEKKHAITIFNTPSKRAYLNAQFLKNLNFSPPPRFVWGTVLNRALVSRLTKDQDVVFHLAAKVNVDESLVNPALVTEINVLGTINVLNAVTAHKKFLVFCSTCEVYGDGHPHKKLNEKAELLPNSPYAASKAAADRLCHSYFKSFGTKVVIIRPFNVFGERQKSGQYGALIPILTARARQGKNLVVFGDGRQTRDFSYVSDMISMYNLVFNKKNLAGQVINFASGHNTAILDIANYIANKFGVKVIHDPARLGEVSAFHADISRARSLGWKPQIKIWPGIDRYLSWAKDNPLYF